MNKGQDLIISLTCRPCQGSQSRSPHITPALLSPPFLCLGSQNRPGLFWALALTPSQLPRWDLAQKPGLDPSVRPQALQLPGDFICIAIQEQMAPLHGKSFISEERASLWHFSPPCSAGRNEPCRCSCDSGRIRFTEETSALASLPGEPLPSGLWSRQREQLGNAFGS